MSRLEELIVEFCQGGVACVKLKEVAQISAGGDLPENYVKGQKVPTEQYPYPIYSNGTEGGALYGFTNSYKIKKDAVTISARGTIGYHEVRPGKFTPIVRLITMVADESKITTKFLHYALYVAGIEGVTTGIPSLTVPMLEKFTIPLPPLPVQQEIVRILDTFTALEAELEAELEARKKQYEYYRNSLLSFEADSENVRWMTLGEVGTIVRGNGLQKADFTEVGVGCIHYGQIYTYYGTFTDKTKSFVSPDLAKTLKKVNKNDLIITNTSENVDDVCKAVAWLGDNEIVTGGHATILKQNENPKYLAYYMQTPMFYSDKRKYATGTKVIDVSATNLAKIIVPIPTIEEQNRIVAILDRFDALTTDITLGLPAEIAARHKQYEYYRDKLLTFKEKVS